MLIRNVKFHSAITVLVCFFISSSLALTTSTDGQTILLLLYGGTSLYHIAEQAAFLFIIILLQCYNTNLILFFLRNIDYLRIRYPDPLTYSSKLILRTATNTTLFFVFSFVGAISALLFIRPNEFNFNFIELIFTGYLVLMIFAFAQILLLLFFKESNAFGALSIITVAFIFLSHFNTLAPTYHISPLILKSLFFIFIIICEIFSILIALKRKSAL